MTHTLMVRKVIKYFTHDKLLREFKYLILLLSFYTPCLAQQAEDSTWAVGIGIGRRMYYGSMGFGGEYPLNIIQKRVKVGAGFGLSWGAVVGANAKFKLADCGTKYALLLSAAYSYQFKSHAQYDISTLVTDYYSVGQSQFMHYSVTNRFYVKRYVALQLDIGYAPKISGGKVNLIYGPNLHMKEVTSPVNTGFILGFDLIVFMIK
ncbi:MAG: hypothetical protein GC181_10895 [Bacteroidetes bacterium]|nr:hypothetical protein [Bacteroidota bacterium]